MTANSARHRSRRKGSVVLFVALGMTVILGCGAISVDYGLMVADKNRLQRGCDAAALAGVSQLKITGDDNYDTAKARALAVSVAAENNVVVPAGNIVFLNDNKQIQVPAIVTRNFFFGPAIGIPNKQVSAKATAGLSAGDDLTTDKTANRVVPIGITWETYNAFKNTRGPQELSLIRQNKEVFGFEDFVLFDLRDTNAKSPAFMERQVTGQDYQVVNLYDYETTLNAANPATTGKLSDGVNTLFDEAAAPPYNDNGSDDGNGNSNNGNGNGNGNGNNSSDGSAYFQSILTGVGSRDNPRVVQLIVTPSTTEAHNGTYDTQVQAFAPVYLEAVYATSGSGNSKGKGKGNSSGDELILRVRFLPPVLAGEGEANSNPNAPLSGVRVSGLVG